MKTDRTVTIRWQRLIDGSGCTCERCGNTGGTVEAAFSKLQNALSELGIQVRLEAKALDFEAFRKAPLESNRIWINDKPLEEWIGGTVSQSRCCDVCGDSECRTILIGAQTFEAVPENLIIKAGLLAAADLFAV